MASKRTPASGGHEIYNFDRPFLGYHYYAVRSIIKCQKRSGRMTEVVKHYLVEISE